MTLPPNRFRRGPLWHIPPLGQSRRDGLRNSARPQTRLVRKNSGVWRGGTQNGNSEAAGQLNRSFGHNEAINRLRCVRLATQANQPGGREGLQKFRENHIFAPETIAATEFYIALDQEFRPLGDLQQGQAPEYQGALDLVLRQSITIGEIDDCRVAVHQVLRSSHAVLPSVGWLELIPAHKLDPAPCYAQIVGTDPPTRRSVLGDLIGYS